MVLLQGAYRFGNTKNGPKRKKINIQKQDSRRYMRKLTVPYACYHFCKSQGWRAFYKWELHSICVIPRQLLLTGSFTKTSSKFNTLRKYLQKLKSSEQKEPYPIPAFFFLNPVEKNNFSISLQL